MCANCFCSIQVKKLEALGYKPILFFGKKNKRTAGKWEADVMTHLLPSPYTKALLEKMQRAYEFILSKGKSICFRHDYYKNMGLSLLICVDF